MTSLIEKLERAPEELSEDAKFRIALVISGHRCHGASPSLRNRDQCWQNIETCRCRIAYEAVPRVARAVIAALNARKATP